MERYRNLAGNAGAVGYEFTADGIKVMFQDKTVYLYTDASAGAEKIREMKKLAAAGQGLTGYINRNVKKAYAARLQ